MSVLTSSRRLRKELDETPGMAIALGGFLALLVAAVDAATGYHVNVTPLYLFPVSLLAFRYGLPAGLLVALLAAAVSALVRWQVRPEQVTTGVFWWNSLTRLATFLAFAVFTATLARRAEQSRMATRDYLTGARNRRGFHERVEEEIARAQRHGRPMAVAYIDLDGFKRLNDTRGHAAGNRALISMVEIVEGRLRGTDTFARLGGDEFAILMPETDESGAANAGQAYLEEIRAGFRSGGFDLTASIGVAVFPRAPVTVEEFLGAADRAMYRAKSDGRDRMVIHVAQGAERGASETTPTAQA